MAAVRVLPAASLTRQNKNHTNKGTDTVRIAHTEGAEPDGFETHSGPHLRRQPRTVSQGLLRLGNYPDRRILDVVLGYEHVADGLGAAHNSPLEIAPLLPASEAA
ncbi:hypothetical protein GB937_004767 [Aspergillus fischeri]|nr:hypothetical protein GB937_004767 [Aspergillus fischeri]